ncbi:hypothetical protein JHK82_027632 [Glycine max]|nr:hypothetical protein JHK82_027632 [Glycine max]
MPPPLEVGATMGVILIACQRQGACHRGNRILRDEAVARLYELGKLGVPNGKCTWSVDEANANAKALLIGSHMLGVPNGKCTWSVDGANANAKALLIGSHMLGVPNGKCTWSVDGANANAKALLIGSHMDCVFCRIRNILCSVILTLELAKPTLMA